MSFRKRNVGISRGGIADASAHDTENTNLQTARPGVRPSPVDGRPTTSTGAHSLDGILAGHAGLALGSALLIEENGTTDYAGALLRFYAAEGILQGQRVLLIGVPEQWVRELPGAIGPAGSEHEDVPRRDKDKMKIAWRYEKLGDFGSGVSASRSRGSNERSPPQIDGKDAEEATPFCHAFDLAKRLEMPSSDSVDYIHVTRGSSSTPFFAIIQKISDTLSASSPNTMHRIVIPGLLSPAIYPTQASEPQNILTFLHTLRSLLKQFSNQVTAMITFPLELYPRATAVVRWMEQLCDGVVELTPFPHHTDEENQGAASGAAPAQEEQPQGLVKAHKLPVVHDRGGAGGVANDLGDDLAFTVSRRKFLIKPFNLPPADGDKDAHKSDSATSSKNDSMEF